MKLFYGEVLPNVVIDDEERHHILKVLRMRDGEPISITDGKGNLASGILRTDGNKARVENPEFRQRTPNFNGLHIAIAPTKNIDRIEFFAEKATEMGITEITFLLTDHSERKILNTEKLRKQIITASKQSLRFHFPKVNELVKLGDFVRKLDPETSFVAHCNPAFERIDIKDFPLKNNFTILIGPEGDFSEREIKMLADKGIRAVSLGDQRLRTETAGVFIAAWNHFRAMQD